MGRQQPAELILVVMSGGFIHSAVNKVTFVQTCQ